MTCDMRKETLIDLLAGELSEEDAVRVEQHLAECRACRAETTALALVTHPFLSEEPWQPDAAMADRILQWVPPEGRSASPAPCAPVLAAGASDHAFVSPVVQPPVSSVVRAGARSPIRARSLWSVPLAWFTRPLPSYATLAVALLALVAGLLLGGGAGRLRARSVLTEAHHSARPLAFVTVCTDATRLTTPGGRDSL